MNLKVFIHPFFRGEDKGEGGIRRVYEAQVKYLPQFGVDVVNRPEEADVLAAHATAPPPWATGLLDRPLVAHCHGLYWRDLEWEDWCYKANADVMECIRMADAVTGPSEWVSQTLRRHTSRYVKTIYHGIDMAEWEPAKNLNYVLWNKTRPDPICDPQPMQLAAALLPDIKFVSTFGEENSNVKITGKLPYSKAKELVRHAGVYLATAKETFGIGTLEAMAAGVPIVGFRWGGQTEIIRQNLDGILVRPGDVNALAQAIAKVFADRHTYSEAARNRAAEFTWESAAEQYADLYKSVRRRFSEYRTRPRTSVVVTNYNLHQYLPAALDSVLAQDDENWECIVVDDASTNPKGREIAADYAARDKRFKVINNQSNAYLAEARNIGIRQAQGRYILPLDADDMLAPSAISSLAAVLDSDRSVHITYGRVKFVLDDGMTPATFRGFSESPGYSGWPLPFTFGEQLHNFNLLPYCSMFRREVWEQTGGYRPRCRTAEDADFWTRVTSYGFRPRFLAGVDTLIYRNREGSMSRVQSRPEWSLWYPWAKRPETIPAGAVTKDQQPVDSLDRTTVSVIIPVGPYHRTLVKDALDSVDAQSFRDWECIVVNDSGAPLDELPAWVNVVDTTAPTTIGVAAARNLGIKTAKAPLFLPLDADDYLQPNALAVMVDAHMRTRDIIYCDFWENPEKVYVEFSDTKPTGDIKKDRRGKEYWIPSEGQLTTFRLRDYDASNLTKGTLHPVTSIVPISVWRDVGGYDESLPAWEDWDFQLKCADQGFCSRRVAAPLFVYRKDTGRRRNENIEAFEESKAAILEKWGDVWEGRKTLMACGSCAARQSIMPPPNPSAQSMRDSSVSKMASADIVQVNYTGNKQGTQMFKGRKGNYYQFSAFEPTKYVFTEDAVVFQGRVDFEIVELRPEIEEGPIDGPALVALGAPSNG